MGAESDTIMELEALKMAANNMMEPSESKRQHQHKDKNEQAVSVRQVAELAAAAAHRKSLDEDELLSGGAVGGVSPPQRPRMVTRHRSSGASLSRHRSGSGLRAMSRSVAAGGAQPVMRGTPGVGGAGPASPRRGVNRSMSSDVSPMLSRSFARSSLLRTDDNGDVVAPQRGVRRAQSSAAGTTSSHRAAPLTRGVGRADSSRGVPQRRGVGRTCSQNSLKHMSQNGTGVSSADVGTLRPYRGREGNLSRSDSSGLDRMSRSAQMSMLRRAVDDRSVGEISNFSMATMDSVNLRKQQCVADPLDDASYREIDSVADHESIFTMATNDVLDYTEYLPEYGTNHVPYDGVSVADTLASDVESYTSRGGGGGNGGNRQPQRTILENTRLLLDSSSNHSRPDQIACDAISLSTMGGEIEEEDDSYFGDDYAATLREEIEAFEEVDDEDYEEESLRLLEGVKEQLDEESAVSSSAL